MVVQLPPVVHDGGHPSDPISTQLKLESNNPGHESVVVQGSPGFTSLVFGQLSLGTSIQLHPLS